MISISAISKLISLTRSQVDTDEYFLEKDYSIDCDSDTYKAVRVYALAMVAVCECPSIGHGTT